MIITKILSAEHVDEYSAWMKSQDSDTKSLYFGVAGNDFMIDHLTEQVKKNPDEHHFLIATQNDKWVGTIHIAGQGETVEFGVIVDASLRGQGLGGRMLEEAIIWTRNRGYKELFMHCLSRNQPIRHLCNKHGLQPRNMHGESEVKMPLPPPNWFTYSKEAGIKQRNLFHMFLENPSRAYKEIYS